MLYYHQLQQSLPFTVLKLVVILDFFIFSPPWLQQSLPFTVLKQDFAFLPPSIIETVATVLTVYGIETLQRTINICWIFLVATVLTVYGIETLNYAY